MRRIPIAQGFRREGRMLAGYHRYREAVRVFIAAIRGHSPGRGRQTGVGP